MCWNYFVKYGSTWLAASSSYSHSSPTIALPSPRDFPLERASSSVTFYPTSPVRRDSSQSKAVRRYTEQRDFPICSHPPLPANPWQQVTREGKLPGVHGVDSSTQVGEGVVPSRKCSCGAVATCAIFFARGVVSTHQSGTLRKSAHNSS